MIFLAKYLKIRLSMAVLLICIQGGFFVDAHDADVVPGLEKTDTHVADIDVRKYADMEKSNDTNYRITLAIYADLNGSNLSNLQFCQQMTEKLNGYPRPKDVVRTKAIFLEFCQANHVIKHPVKDNPQSPFYEGATKKRKKMIYPMKEYVGNDKKSPMPIIRFKTEKDQRAHLERQRVVSEQLIARDQLRAKPPAQVSSRGVRTKSSPAIGRDDKRLIPERLTSEHLTPERLTSEPILAPDQSSSVFSGHFDQKKSSLESSDGSFQERSPESGDAINPFLRGRLPTRAEFKKSVRGKKLERQKVERAALDKNNIRGDD